jgi:hypothetical protein
MPEASFVYRDASSFDFSDADTYRKTATLDKSNVKTAKEGQEVVTIIDGKVETTNTAHEGDKIITGPKGEEYIIRKEKFDGLYQTDPNNPNRYISSNVIKAKVLTEDTEITAPWGEKQRAAKGGMVAQRVGNPDDVYLIEEGAFKATYSHEGAGNLSARAGKAAGIAGLVAPAVLAAGAAAVTLAGGGSIAQARETFAATNEDMNNIAALREAPEGPQSALGRAAYKAMNFIEQQGNELAGINTPQAQPSPPPRAGTRPPPSAPMAKP